MHGHVLFYLKIVFENIINEYEFLKKCPCSGYVYALLHDILDV